MFVYNCPQITSLVPILIIQMACILEMEADQVTVISNITSDYSGNHTVCGEKVLHKTKEHKCFL